MHLYAFLVSDYGPYGDQESRSFYEDFPDLLSSVPLTLLGLTPEQAAALREKWKVEAAGEEKELEEDDGAMGDESLQDQQQTSGSDSTATTAAAAAADAEAQSEEKEKDEEVESGSTEGTAHARLMSLLQVTCNPLLCLLTCALVMCVYVSHIHICTDFSSRSIQSGKSR
jgi:hypothetical protein